VGLNYYVELEKCPCCGHTQKRLHLGKMSAGWVFALQVLPEEGLNCLDSWQELIVNTRAAIIDEYGQVVDWPTLRTQIKTRRWEMPWEPGADSRYKSEKEFLQMNQAERGPSNLLRSKIDGIHCVGHDNMCDLIVGDFS
jgi:hypothetical protein